MPALVYANHYTGNTNAVTTSTGSAWAFGFNATYLRVINDKATKMYVTLTTGTEAGYGSTNGIRTCASEVLELRQIMSAGVAFASTTTTTGTLANFWAIGA